MPMDNVKKLSLHEVEALMQETRDLRAMVEFCGIDPAGDNAVLRACRALDARDRFEEEAPWAGELPIKQAEIDDFLKSAILDLKPAARNLGKAIGWFAQSLRWADWIEAHPTFYKFGCGLTAVITPLYQDENLRALFPPRKLLGLVLDPMPHWVG